MGYKEFINILFSKPHLDLKQTNKQKTHLVIVGLENAYHINAKKFRYSIKL